MCASCGRGGVGRRPSPCDGLATLLRAARRAWAPKSSSAGLSRGGFAVASVGSAGGGADCSGVSQNPMRAEGPSPTSDSLSHTPTVSHPGSQRSPPQLVICGSTTSVLLFIWVLGTLWNSIPRNPRSSPDLGQQGWDDRVTPCSASPATGSSPSLPFGAVQGAEGGGQQTSNLAHSAGSRPSAGSHSVLVS